MKVKNMAFGLMTILMAAGYLQAETAKVVRAERFEIVDSKGNVRAVLGMDKDEPRIDFLDKKGASRFQVNIGPGGNPELSLKGENAQLSVWDEKYSRYFGVRMSSSEGPSVVVSDAPAGAQAIFGIASGHTPVLFMGNDGHPVKGPNHPEVAIAASAPDAGGGHLTINDANGTNRINMGAPLIKSKEPAAKSSEPVLQIFDKDHKLVWESPLK